LETLLLNEREFMSISLKSLATNLGIVLICGVPPSLFATPTVQNDINYDFCNTSAALEADPATDPIQTLRLWNAQDVQEQLRTLTNDANLLDTPWNSYPITYVAMTKARDFERCHGILATPNLKHQLIGDLLADMMSRWLALSMMSCGANTNQGDPTYGFCAAMDRTLSSNIDTLGSALEITSVYLSSHMAMALAAVVHDDLFWNGEFPPATHCPSFGQKTCPQQVILERIRWVEDYKVHYNRNNRFLAKNVVTIIKTLRQACYIRGEFFETSATLAQQLPLPVLELFFGNIRDKTFRAGLELAKTIDPSAHPMLAKGADGLYHRQFTNIKFFNKMPRPLAAAEDFARTQLRGPLLLTSIFSGLGSRTWRDLAANPPSKKGLCNQGGEIP
jgi:hypothetical protein